MLEHYRGHEVFVRRIIDHMNRSERQWRCLVTPFLTPYEQEIAKSVIGKQMFYRFDGGYPEAEMQRLAIAPFEIQEPMDTVCLCAKLKDTSAMITHRDVLGALMRLQIEREVIGDIIVQDQKIYVFVLANMCDFIIQECKRIQHHTITFSICEKVVEKKQTMQYKTKTVQSMRLDCIVAACTNVSRTKAETLIRSKLVKVNHIPLEECKALCHNNSTISIRGYGRFHIQHHDQKSRKGRWIIEIGSYK